jgi:hypothetical protein
MNESETKKWGGGGGGLSQFEVGSQNFLGVTGKDDKRKLNHDTRTPGLNPSRYTRITLMTVIQLWAYHSVQTLGESKHNTTLHFIL